MSTNDLAACGVEPTSVFNQAAHRAWYECMTATPAWIDSPAHVALLLGLVAIFVAAVVVLLVTRTPSTAPSLSTATRPPFTAS